ncbi:hypothetical protein [Pseudomonas sp.]|uniref:hypothetical protein n=1 Tax=Pseudomonas sp. TaxID=306 RepID=UPI00299DFC6B|nr:hypothetical protein [Pseudomonas sp.]MDX1367164.1 hypothetical protein [Pseudomonas sp.]
MSLIFLVMTFSVGAHKPIDAITSRLLRDSAASKTGPPLLPNQHAGNQAQQQQAQQRPTTVQTRACTSNGSLSPAVSKMRRKTLDALLEIASHDFKHNNCPFCRDRSLANTDFALSNGQMRASPAWPVPPVLLISGLRADDPPYG